MSAGSRRSRLRGWWKALALLFSLLQCLASFLGLRLRGRPTDAQRAAWLHRCCKMVLRRLVLGVHLFGNPPATGLVVSNHLSYFDILLYGATLPCVFVAKAEVRSWPLLGLLAALGGTVFIDRRSAPSAARAGSHIERLLAAGVAVLIFPEGTSSDGSTVLPFHPSLFEPAVRATAPVTAAAIGYSAGVFARERDLCYYGDISFGPHLLRCLQLPQVSATVQFGSPGQIYQGRKQAASDAHRQVKELRARSRAC